MGNRKRHNSAISILPDDIIVNILGRLLLRLAATTSILSKDWRNKWTCIPDLVFDFDFGRTVIEKHKLEPVIYQVLLNRQRPINKFSLQVRSYGSSSLDVDNWIRILSDHKVQDFTLHFCCSPKYRMPSHFFALQHLKHLDLYRCVVSPPPGFKGFGRLVTLNYQSVNFEPALFERFISQCVLLERLRLVACTDWDSFEIEGPSLRFFSFHGVFKCIRFKNCPVLAEVSLSSPTQFYARHETNHGHAYFELLPTLEKLYLQPDLVELLGAGLVPNLYRCCLINLKVLGLSMLLDKIEEIAFALSIIRSSPNLQTLNITFFFRKVVKAITEFIRAQEVPNQYLKHVRRVEIRIFSGIKPQMEFVKYILASATQLEEMVVTPADSELRSKFIVELELLQRASPGARIIVN